MSTQISDIIKDLNSRKIVLVTSIPGMGLNTLIRSVLKQYKLGSKDIVIEFFPHEETLAIDSLFLQKLSVEGTIPVEFLTSVIKVQQYLAISNRGILIVTHKIDFFSKPDLILNYLDSIYRSTNRGISTLISANLEVFSKIPQEVFRRRIQEYVYKGLEEDYEDMLKELCLQNDITLPKPAIRKQLWLYSFGHLGILLSLLKLYKEHGTVLDVAILLSNSEVLWRFAQIKESMKNAGLDLLQLLRSNNTLELERVGIVKSGITSPLMFGYASTFVSAKNNWQEILTPSEENLLSIFETHKDEYINIDKILLLLGEAAFEKSSNWAIYKHINNIKKKLRNFNIRIENKRGKGYRLLYWFRFCWTEILNYI